LRQSNTIWSKYRKEVQVLSLPLAQLHHTSLFLLIALSYPFAWIFNFAPQFVKEHSVVVFQVFLLRLFDHNDPLLQLSQVHATAHA
jgi:hypothetical protein